MLYVAMQKADVDGVAVDYINERYSLEYVLILVDTYGYLPSVCITGSMYLCSPSRKLQRCKDR